MNRASSNFAGAWSGRHSCLPTPGGADILACGGADILVCHEFASAGAYSPPPSELVLPRSIIRADSEGRNAPARRPEAGKNACPTGRQECLPHQRRGFTLIEVLATLLLLAIALPVILHGISIATSAGSLAKQRSEAYGLCESKLNELLATGQYQYGNLSGDFSPDFPKYRWIATVQDWTDPNTEQLDVHVKWTSRGAEQDVVLSSLVYPNASPATLGSSGSPTPSTGTNTGSSGGIR